MSWCSGSLHILHSWWADFTPQEIVGNQALAGLQQGVCLQCGQRESTSFTMAKGWPSRATISPVGKWLQPWLSPLLGSVRVPVGMTSLRVAWLDVPFSPSAALVWVFLLGGDSFSSSSSLLLPARCHSSLSRQQTYHWWERMINIGSSLQARSKLAMQQIIIMDVTFFISAHTLLINYNN